MIHRNVPFYHPAVFGAQYAEGVTPTDTHYATIPTAAAPADAPSGASPLLFLGAGLAGVYLLWKVMR